MLIKQAAFVYLSLVQREILIGLNFFTKKLIKLVGVMNNRHHT